MKKYLLTALLGVFGLCTAFASADSVVYTDGVPSPSSIYYVGNFSCELTMEGVPDLGYQCITPINFNTNDYNLSYSINRILLNGETEFSYTLANQSSASSSIMLIDVFNTDFVNGNYDYLVIEFGNVDGEEGTFSISSNNLYTSLPSSDSDSSPILSGGTTAFSGIITSLGSAVSEFIPYVAYIGIGLLGAIIGFVAIKRLINRVRAKIFGTFSGGRRR